MKVSLPVRLLLFPIVAFAFFAATPVHAEDAPAKTGVDQIIGDWLRPDGGYVIEIKSIAEDGKASVVYLNPKPINVESASATETDKGISFKMVLRDEGYPGSSYDLMYDAAKDQLKGSYTQPASGQTYRVEFIRKP